MPNRNKFYAIVFNVVVMVFYVSNLIEAINSKDYLSAIKHSITVIKKLYVVLMYLRSLPTRTKI